MSGHPVDCMEQRFDLNGKATPLCKRGFLDLQLTDFFVMSTSKVLECQSLGAISSSVSVSCGQQGTATGADKEL